MMMAEENKEESSFRYYQIHMTLKMTMLKNRTTLISKHDTMKLKTVQLQSPLSTWVSLKKKVALLSRTKNSGPEGLDPKSDLASN